ncbi:MAG: mevalonate kinase [Gemmatimonadota bacterium]
MGEHSVVYGQPALVAALDLRLLVLFRGRPGKARGAVHLRLSDLGHTSTRSWPELIRYADICRERWLRHAAAPESEPFERVRGADPAHVVMVALGEVASDLGERDGPDLEIEVRSALPVGAGFGSSAAVAVGVMGGYLAWRGIPVTESRLLRLALEVERRQHGSPSGVDGAAVLRGGLIWTEGRPGGRRSFEPVEAREDRLRNLALFDTGTPRESTGAVVESVKARVRQAGLRFQAVLDEMGEATRRFRDALGGASERPSRVVELIRRFEAGLEELGVVPEPARALVRRVEAEGGAAKISGAGALSAGPGGRPCAGSLLVYHPEPERMDEWPFLRDLPRYRVRLGAEGFRADEAP